MGRKLEWELSGKSDVPQKMAAAKASVDGLSRASDALSKKFKDGFKDIALGFLAPMVLINQGINLFAQKIEEAKQRAKEAREFAKEEESKRYSPAGGREAILQYMEQEKERENREKGQAMAIQGYQKFLELDPRGKAILEEYNKSDAAAADPLRGILPAAVLAGMNAEIQKKIEAALAPDIAARQAAEDAKKEGEKAKEGAAKSAAEVSSNVVGVGMSPQLELGAKQLSVQEDMANSLRIIAEKNMTEYDSAFVKKTGNYSQGRL